MAITHLTTVTFDEAISSEKPVLVDFWATWCGPCQMLGPVLENIAEEHPDFNICKVNVDEEPELAARYGIMTIPTMIVFKEGKEIDKLIGLRPPEDIITMLTIE